MTKKLVSFDDQAEPGQGLPAAVKAELNATYADKGVEQSVASEAAVRGQAVSDLDQRKADRSEVSTAVSDALSQDATVAQAASDAVAQAAVQDAGLRDAFTARRASLSNILTYGDHASYPTGWSWYTGTSGTVAGDGTVTLVSSGQYRTVGQQIAVANRPTGKGGHKWFVKSRMRVRTAGAESLTVYAVVGGQNVGVNGRVTSVANPEVDKWYTIVGTITLPAAAEGVAVPLWLAGIWPTAGAGQTVEIEQSVVVDLTAAYGPGQEPPAWVLDADLGSDWWVPASSPRTQQTFAARAPQVFARARKHATGAGPHVVMRFDDGYVDNLTIAAPIMAQYGQRGTIYVGTNPTTWLGGSQAGVPLMSIAQLVDLHTRFGWEIASHTRTHEDAIDTPLSQWATAVDRSIDDLVGYGLPAPTSLAYPNGSRSDITDRLLTRRFRHVGTTNSQAPARFDTPHLFHGWLVVPSVAGGAGNRDFYMDRLKRHVAASFAAGQVPVVGWHSVVERDDQIVHDYQIDAPRFAEFCRWLDTEGYPVGTQKELPTPHLIADHAFTSNPIWSGTTRPWQLDQTSGWARTRKGTYQNLWEMALTAATAYDGSFRQTFAVTPGQTINLHMGINITDRTAGQVQVDVQFRSPVGSTVSTETGVCVANAVTAGEVDRPGQVTVPAGAFQATAIVRAVGFTGAARVQHVTAMDAGAYNPLALV